MDPISGSGVPFGGHLGMPRVQPLICGLANIGWLVMNSTC